MTHSESLDKLAPALVKAQAQVKNAKKDSDNPFFKSKYADLASVTEACKDAFADNGLAVVQMPGFADGKPTMRAVIVHESGQWLECGEAAAPFAGKSDAQAVGSIYTYLRRYQLSALAWVATEDDDGNAASAPTKKDSRPLAAKKDELQISGKPVSKCSSKTLIEAKAFYKDRPEATKLVEQIDEELEKRRETAVDSLSV